ncbi:uncharacterized protein LOC111716125, partial [Eurytemora carolleeae]|uniref:uncharacterized protein LOC111716125 n=1 Tax=Eurytemora carolleeae TaxID=1294199 RepID=UPI000C76F6BE
MGSVLDKLLGEEEGGGDAAVKRQAEGFSNPMYGLANLIGQGLLVDLSKKAMITGNYKELDDAIRMKIPKYLYNNGKGKWIHCAHLACLRNRDRSKRKQFPEILGLGEESFSFKFEDSELLQRMIGDDTPENSPEKYTLHAWDVECRGAVGETVFHVCFLMGTPVHLHLAKRLLKHYPLLLNDIYLSE